MNEMDVFRIEDNRTSPPTVKEYEVVDSAAREDISELKADLSQIAFQQNLFNPATVVYGSYQKTDGTTQADGAYSHSAQIPVQGGKTYTYPIYTSKFGSGALSGCFVKSDETFITATGVNNNGILTITAPTNAVAMIVNVKNTDVNTFMVSKGQSLPEEYIPYNTVLLKENVRPQNIETSNTDFISNQAITNYFNINDADIITGKDIKYDDTFIDNSNMNVSGFIPCTEGETFTFPVYTGHFGTGSMATYVACYNANKEWTRAINGTLNGAILTFTVSAGYGIKYFRVNFTNKSVNSNYIQTPYHAMDCFMVVKGSSLPTRYYPYTPQPVIASNIYSGHENMNNPLYGKRVMFTGDSICEGDAGGGWAERIGKTNTMLWENCGIGGSTIAVTSAGKTICIRPLTMTDPEYIILEGGTNDADRIGDATGETKPEAFGTWDADNYGTDDATTYYGFDINTFCGAVDYMCKRFVSLYVGAKIGFIGAQKMGTVDATRANRGYYIHTAMEICRKWGIPCLNLWDECYLNPLIPSHYTSGEDYMYIDGQHLTANGYEYITQIIEAWMKTL